MKINYDSEVDALYIEFRDILAAKNIDIEEGVTVDLDKDNHIVGIEILDAQERLKESLSHLEFSEIPWKKTKLAIKSK